MEFSTSTPTGKYKSTCSYANVFINMYVPLIGLMVNFKPPENASWLLFLNLNGWHSWAVIYT
jgi:hypothetical protein